MRQPDKIQTPPPRMRLCLIQTVKFFLSWAYRVNHFQNWYIFYPRVQFLLIGWKLRSHIIYFDQFSVFIQTWYIRSCNICMPSTWQSNFRRERMTGGNFIFTKTLPRNYEELLQKFGKECIQALINDKFYFTKVSSKQQTNLEI